MDNKILSENKAISIVSSTYPEYWGMTKSESPDFYKIGLGLEITHAISEKYGDAESFVNMNIGKRYSDLSTQWLHNRGYREDPTPWDEHQILYIQRNTRYINLIYAVSKHTQELILIGYICNNLEEYSIQNNILGALNKKLIKLNKHYAIQEKNDLCIIIPELISYDVWTDEVSEVLLTKITVILKNKYSKKEFSVYYDRILLLFADYLFRVDTTSWTYTRYKINK